MKRSSACLENAKAGDPRAVEGVIHALRPRVEKMSAYYARCTGEDPDDLQQEAWHGLLTALPELDTEIGSPEQYLIQRAKWKMLDAVKRARLRRSLPLNETGYEETVVSPEASIDGEVSAGAFAARLATTQRDILTCLLAGLTWRETGARLGFSSANVAYHVRQIRRQYVEWNGEG